MKNVKINNLINVGDNDQFLCKKKWVGTARVGNYNGADVAGVRFQKNSLVVVESLDISDLDSDEGKAIGLEIIGDTNDRTDYKTDGKEYRLRGLKIRYTSVNLKLTD